MNMYQPAVTLYEDGIYRWSYDMDMWHNTFMRNLILKVLAVIFAFPAAFFAVLALSRIFPLLREGLLRRVPPTKIVDMLFPLLITAAAFVGAVLLTLLIYAICALVMHGNYRLYFEMDESGVALVRSPASKNTVSALAVVATVAGIAAEKPGEAMRMGGTLLAANSVGTTPFRSVLRVKLYPDCDVIHLSEWFGMNQIYVNEVNYPFVRDYILGHVREKARGKNRMSGFEL